MKKRFCSVAALLVLLWGSAFLFPAVSQAAERAEAVCLSLNASGEIEATAIDADDVCPNPTSTSTFCTGDRICRAGTVGSSWALPNNGQCPAGYSLTTIGGVDEACDAATVTMRNPAKCTGNCVDQGTFDSPSTTATCCTITRTRNCTPVIVVPPHE